MTRKKHSEPISAGELMAELAQDEEYQRKKAAFDAELQKRVNVWRTAERPIVADLKAVGVEVDSVWDLVNTSIPYPAALPVLLAHLQYGGYPDRVMEGMARALAVKPSVVYWDELATLCVRAKGPEEREGLAVALAASATPKQFDALVSLLSEESIGDDRIHFLRAIKRTGGERGKELLESLTSDPLFGKQSTILAKKSRPRRPAKK